MAKDETPKFDKLGLDKFFRHGYDPLLGWVRKPNTSGIEKGRYGETSYHINSKGARETPDYEGLPTLISCYGDSFTFCRQVNDNETWEYYLSKISKTNVLNFGVGNYGLDQAFLRLKREFPSNKTKVVILAVVPETISRILNVWKHYLEYGNTFGFKPRFVLENKKLKFIPNIIDDESRLLNYKNYLKLLQQNDYFYKRKFKRDLMQFPYLFSLIKTAKRNIPLICRLIKKEVFDVLHLNPDYKDYVHNRSVLQRNIAICGKLYQNTEVELLFIMLIEEFVNYAKANNFTPVFILLPQLNDLIYIHQKGCYYESFVNKIKEKLLTIDFTDSLLSLPDYVKIYSNDHYGGHFSKHGNEYIANMIFEVFNKNAILPFNNIFIKRECYDKKELPKYKFV